MNIGYDFTRDDLATLVVGMQFPERSRDESALLTQFLLRHGHEYDRYQVSVRVGQGRTPDPAHLPGVQLQTVEGSKLRIDMLAFQGAQPSIFEVKKRANHHAIGQLLTYRHLWQEEHLDAPEPRLAVIAEAIEPDMERVFAAQGIVVYLYEPAPGDRGATPSGVPTVDGGAA